MKQLKLIALSTFMLLMLGLASYAQGPGFDDDVEDDVPLDGGVTLVAAAAVCYGAKKLHNRNKNS